MKGILLMSHGTLCYGMINSLEMLGADTDKVKAIALFQDTGLDDYAQEISGALEELDDGEGVFVITDIISGTPFNQVCQFYEEKNIEIITGMNLPMVIFAIHYRDYYSLEELGNRCIDEAKNCMVTMKSILH